jgi:tetratricopeptide (TPR) repeat protein
MRALANFVKAREIREKLAMADPSDADHQVELALIYRKLGDTFSTDNHPGNALEYHQKALAIREKLALADPRNADRQSDLAYSYGRVGEAQLEIGNQSEALADYQKALAIREQLAASDAGNADCQRCLAYVYQQIANLQLKSDNRIEAITNYQKVVAIREKLAAAEPNNPDRLNELASGYDNLGSALAANGKAAEALENYRKSLGIREKAAALTESAETAEGGKPGEKTARALGSLAWGALLARSFEKALTASDQAIALAPDLLWLKTNRAHALMFLGRNQEAQNLYLKFKGQMIPSRHEPWDVVIANDFTQFRKIGLDRIAGSVMAEVGRALGQ